MIKRRSVIEDILRNRMFSAAIFQIKMDLKSAFLIILSLAACVCASTHGIGVRVKGDSLLINDTFYDRTKSLHPANLTIEFQYQLDKLLSYIELSSSSNMEAKFELTHNSILFGTVTAISCVEFEMRIRVFGIDKRDAPPGFQPLLSPDRELVKRLAPHDYMDDDYYDIEELDESVIGIGERQPGDELLYENFQHSETSIETRNHSLVFYYVDSHYITHAEFITLHTDSASAIFSHISDHSLKAVITDQNVISLDVKFNLYGYQPDKKPSSYISIFSNAAISSNDATIFDSNSELCPPMPLTNVGCISKSESVFMLSLLFLYCLLNI